MEGLKCALTKKKVFKSNTTKLRERISAGVEVTDDTQIELFQTKIKKLRVELHDVFHEVFLQCNDKEIEMYIEEQQSIEKTIDELWLTVERKNSKQRVNSTSDADSLKSQVPDVRLPKLSLPTFSGNVEDWLSFHDLFKASVDNNSNLSNCQKLQYLKSSCRGYALKIIQSLPILDSNYETAMELLRERFSNKRELVNALIKKSITIPSITDSSQSILQAVDITNECVRSLSVLDQDITGFSEVLIVYLITEKFDKNTRSWWERTLKKDELGTLETLLTFLKDHARTLQVIKLPPKEPRSGSYPKVTSLVSGSNTCFLCKNEHSLSKCSRFTQMSTQKRIDVVKRNRLCFNCLTARHQAKTCMSLSRCRICGKLHHTMLHISRDSEVSSTLNSGKAFSPPLTDAPPSQSTPYDLSSPTTTTCAGLFDPSSTIGVGLKGTKQVLLCTALVKVSDSSGNFVTCRALLDSGSEASFVTEDCINRLCLTKNSANVRISCLGSFHAVTSGEIELTFTPHFSSDLKFSTKAFVIKKITSDVPNVPLPPHLLNNFNDLVLADPFFFETRPVDILLGVNVFFTMLKGDIIRRKETLPFAVCTKLGWIIAGTAFLHTINQPIFSVNNIQLTTKELVEKFWALDSVPEARRMSKLDQECEDHFRDTHYRDKSGRYVVRLPFKQNPSCLGYTKELVLQRFKALEYKLSRTPETYELYKEFMREYIELGHMELVDQSGSSGISYYIPHHPVMKESSTTTKLRVVFNASTKSSSGVSLNDILMVGPRIQQELFPILMRFRTFPIVITADIMKMFRQILINEKDRDFQRVFWRNDASDPIHEYRLVTVTYGTTPAPFLATRTLHQLADDEGDNFPLASKAIIRDFYVDDLLSGAQSTEECQLLVDQLTALMTKGGFVLRKWTSNDPSVLEKIPKELRDSSESVKLQEDNGIKILGINWIPQEDCFRFFIPYSDEQAGYTKREILSDLAKIFDPLGWLAPCVVYAKILIQELWKCQLSWDEPITAEVEHKWKLFRNELTLLGNLKIPRFVSLPRLNVLDIHAFCDASEKAYCAVVYTRTMSTNCDVKVTLLTSKTKVAPLKVQSLPRLELCAAVLLANLLQTVLKYLDVPIRDIFAWSDSTVVLAWISSESYRWVPFIANRVEKNSERNSYREVETRWWKS
ncbi:uncharacterized protein [Centruroides vittatus]|uniref:uncharacterized protein n=1 Tax=Centruroides vittatus TaxID=120091 RepID=UPI00350FA85E